MGKAEIVETLAKEKAVERMVLRITRGASASALDANGKDLAQMVYQIILEYDEDKVVDLWEHGEIGFFLARIIQRQAFYNHSEFYGTIRKFSARSCELDAKTIAGNAC